MKTFIQLLLSLVLLTALQGVRAGDAGLPGTLRVGTSAGYPPLTFKQDGQLQGMEIDLAKAVGKQLDIPVQFVELPFNDLIPALSDGKIDVIMSGMSITDERTRQVLFTRPYMQIGQMGLIRVDDLTVWSRPDTLYDKHKIIGVKQGTTGDRFVSEEIPDGDIRRFDSIDEGVAALRTKKIDIFIHDAPTIWRLSAQYDTWDSGIMGLFRPLTDENLAWAVRPGNTPLADALNTALDTMKKDGSLKTIRTHWIPVQVTVGNPPDPGGSIRQERPTIGY